MGIRVLAKLHCGQVRQMIGLLSLFQTLRVARVRLFLVENLVNECIKINSQFPHWFCDNYVKYNFNEKELPVDQHQLIALIAPRPVYVASVALDFHAYPKGEMLSLHYASPDFELYGNQKFSQDTLPKKNKPIVFGKMGYHIRDGVHDIKKFDIERFMDFADLFLKKE